jgi:creatinine amidohydrolase/Fe(II)-dependent formamide hydrolase-like protein
MGDKSVLHIQKEVVGDVDVYESDEDIERLGVFGNPKMASKSKGRQHLDRLIGYIEDAIRTIPPSGFYSNWQTEL